MVVLRTYRQNLEKINTIFDLILTIPSKYTDRSIETKINDLQIENSNGNNIGPKI